MSRRSVLALAGLLLAGAPALGRQGPGLLLPVGDLAKLFRRLLTASREGVRVSKPLRLTDPDTGRRATLLIADDGEETLAMLLTFAIVGDPLHVHSLSVVLDDGDSPYLELFGAPPEGRKHEETVGARIDDEILERLAGASTVTLVVRGWDETFTAVLRGKELRKIRRFADKRRDRNGDADPGDADDDIDVAPPSDRGPSRRERP